MKPNDFVSSHFKIKYRRWPVFSARGIMGKFGEEAVRLIRLRVARGKQSDGSPMPAYDPEYRSGKKSIGTTKRNSSLTGATMESLRVLKRRKDSVKIGWGRTSSRRVYFTGDGRLITSRGKVKHRAIVERLARGAHGPKRQILGITKADHARLARWLRDRKKQLVSKK